MFSEFIRQQKKRQKIELIMGIVFMIALVPGGWLLGRKLELQTLGCLILTLIFLALSAGFLVDTLRLGTKLANMQRTLGNASEQEVNAMLEHAYEARKSSIFITENYVIHLSAMRAYARRDIRKIKTFKMTTEDHFDTYGIRISLNGQRKDEWLFHSEQQRDSACKVLSEGLLGMSEEQYTEGM